MEEALQSQKKKEEEEEILRKKPNPFGSARPREVVLQERGIDWRSLDTSFHRTGRVPGKENRPKQNRPTSLTPKRDFPSESHQAEIHGIDPNCRHHALPAPAANACLLIHSSRERIAEAIQCPQMDASWSGPMQRPSCRRVDPWCQNSVFAATIEGQLPQKFNRILEQRSCYGHLERNYIEEPSCRRVDPWYQNSVFAATNEGKHNLYLTGSRILVLLLATVNLV